VAVGWILVISINHFLCANNRLFEFGFVRALLIVAQNILMTFLNFSYQNFRLAENRKYDDNRSRQKNLMYSSHTQLTGWI